MDIEHERMIRRVLNLGDGTNKPREPIPAHIQKAVDRGEALCKGLTNRTVATPHELAGWLLAAELSLHVPQAVPTGKAGAIK